MKHLTASCFALRRGALLLLLIVMQLASTSHAGTPLPYSALRTRPIPVWIYEENSFACYRDEQGVLRGFYPALIAAFNRQYGFNLRLMPIDGEQVSQRFAANQWGLYAGVARTAERTRTHLLSAKLLDADVVAASLNTQAWEIEDLQNTRVAFRRHDITRDQIHRRYPELKFKEQRLVASSEEAFALLNRDSIDFYINDAGEMDDMQRNYLISHPFPELKIQEVIALSPQLAQLREPLNNFIANWRQNNRLLQLQDTSKRQYLISRLRLTADEKAWIANNTLELWLPQNENFAPFIWHDKGVLRGTVIDLINDLRDLLHMKIDVHYIDNYTAALRNAHWPVRLINISSAGDKNALEDAISPAVPYHNVYYNAIGQSFLWDENRLRHHRVGVLQGSFSDIYLQENFAPDVEIISKPDLQALTSAVENRQVDYILGDLSSLETSLRGDEVFRDVLKVAGMTHSNYVLSTWVAADHPLHDLLARVSVISRHQAQMEHSYQPENPPQVTRNTLKILGLLMLLAALFAIMLMLVLWRQKRQSRVVNHRIVVAMEQVNRAHDDETGSHIRRVSLYCGLMARELKLPKKLTRDIQTYASLHDVGKIAVPDRVLRKQGPLTPEEFAEMKLHTTKGWLIIRQLELGSVAENIVHYHHEKWDGSGYPQGLKGSDIPLEARILAVADVYDALRQKRVYKPGFSHENACAIITQGAGHHFDPELVRLFTLEQQKFRAIFDSHAD
ncbi:HD domain-containing phosphohydrolase [Entomohabitans teleogrylli]|uniref:HD domain-containing phosphohydrolase n=1 Tax=Entomohabitans teleogrylli TaxID=1384589 RepID=UPI000A5F8AAB|nr:HD domain-containing phosphohydrolase [Entomohabitans teleogrylli]